MIKYIKRVEYYKNSIFHHSAEIEKKTFYTIEEAKNYLQQTTLKYYYNKKDISLIESAEVLHREKDTFKKYYKAVDFQGLITTNLKDPEDEEIL